MDEAREGFWAKIYFNSVHHALISRTKQTVSIGEKDDQTVDTRAIRIYDVYVHEP